MRVLLRLVLIVIVVVAAALLLFGYWAGRERSAGPAPIGTAGRVDAQKARETGARIAERAAEASAKVEETVAEAGLTAKIKAKMALDDSVKARAIDVTTNGSTVTLTGTVHSAAEHDRAVALARETIGVSQVVDHLRVAP